ncbi:alpha/beta hydrolase family protein [Sphingosinithalassobacter sp. CS137]|uniref:alpha/beta hydrolase family protein n=1 Tax=Sphingosinithalassobacter sp. CS137 TaxID=2762748 RepID=UPI00165E5634|nr:alpha/beta fold hydrolase [Sphingosinithalassobacter sp. CS137]
MRCNPLLLLPPLLLAGCATTAGAPPAEPLLYAQTFTAERPRDVRTLVIVLNGDGLPAARADETAFARTAAAAIPDSAAVALLRPGYADTAGNRSPGSRGFDAGDNYTLEQITAVGDAVAALQARYPSAQIVLVGESGGAVIAANLAAMRPELLDGIVLVGCPCTLPEWRDHMERRMPGEPWETPVSSLDPLKTAGGIASDLRAAVIVGAEDEVTPVRFSRAYAEALTLRGVATDYRILPGKGHKILNDPEVLAATGRLAASLPVGS